MMKYSLLLALFAITLLNTGCQKEELEKQQQETQRQKALADSLQKALEATNQFKSRVIEDFGESSSKLEERLRENEKLAQTIEEARDRIEKRDKRIDTLILKLQLRGEELGLKQKQIESQESFLKQQSARFTEVEKQLDNLTKTISERDAAIQKLNKTISERDAAIQKANARIEQQDATIQSLQKDIQAKAAKTAPAEKSEN
jgi:chromosome segregation ATPase